MLKNCRLQMLPETTTCKDVLFFVQHVVQEGLDTACVAHSKQTFDKTSLEKVRNFLYLHKSPNDGTCILSCFISNQPTAFSACPDPGRLCLSPVSQQNSSGKFLGLHPSVPAIYVSKLNFSMYFPRHPPVADPLAPTFLQNPAVLSKFWGQEPP